VTAVVRSRREAVTSFSASTPLPAPSAGERLFYLDACRAAFVLLGIVLHALLAFIPEPWIVASANESAILAHLYNFIHAFRMPAFFVLSGFFAALVLARRGPASWAQSRTLRLGVPLLFGVLFVVPFESLAIVLGEDLAVPGEPLSATAVLAAAAERHFSVGMHLVSHLWFILDLLLISLAFAAFYALLGGARVARIGRAIGDTLARHRLLLGVPALLALALYLVVVQRVAHHPIGNFIAYGGEWPMWHILDGDRIAHYAPFFALGLLLFYSRTLLAAFVRPSALAWAAGTAVTATLLVVVARPGMPWGLATALSAPAAILLTQMSMHLASILVRGHNRVVQWLSEGSYTIYIVHHPIIILLATLAVIYELPAIPGFLLVLILTALLSTGFYAATRNVPLAAFLLNGIVPRRTEERSTGAIRPTERGEEGFVPASGASRHD
jgi:glucans biosynthesis protein C